MAFPIGSYDRFRDIYEVPSPPRVRLWRSFAILLLADREALETLRAQIAAAKSQTYGRWQLYVIGAGSGSAARRRRGSSERCSHRVVGSPVCAMRSVCSSGAANCALDRSGLDVVARQSSATSSQGP